MAMKRLGLATAIAACLCGTFGAASAQDLDAALAQLSARNGAANSDTLLVVQDGRIILDQRPSATASPVRIELMSATKGVVALAVMRAIEQGAIAGLDVPVHQWFPEWKQGGKSAITLRMLLNHTSGIQNLPNTSHEIYPSPDFVQLALAADLVSVPGEQFSYNNKATNLLAGVVERATGSKLDVYVGAQLFAPLGIIDYAWTRDSVGNPHGMAGLHLSAEDAVKLGQLVLDRGQWNGQSLIRSDLIDTMLAPGSAMSADTGLMWVRTPAYRRYTLEPRGIERLREIGLPTAILDRIAPLVGQQFSDRSQMRETLIAALGTDGLAVWADVMIQAGETPTTIFTVEAGPIAAYHAEGYLGQYIVVVPSKRLVAVRQYVSRPAPPPGDSFPSLVDDLIAVAQAMPD